MIMYIMMNREFPVDYWVTAGLSRETTPLPSSGCDYMNFDDLPKMEWDQDTGLFGWHACYILQILISLCPQSF